MSSITLIFAISLDRLFGEPKAYHPLVGFGTIASHFERCFNRSQFEFSAGLLGTLVLVGAPVLACWVFTDFLSSTAWALILINGLVLYWAIGAQSLMEHTQAVRQALERGAMSEARHSLSMIVSRDVEGLPTEKIIQGTIETQLENGSDAIFAPIFWFYVGGAPAVVMYRLVNTLDAMWGYRTDRYERFGKSVAITDDVLNFIPARLVAGSYAVLGNTRMALSCWIKQASSIASPNAGPVMTSGGGSLNISLGGPTSYHGKILDKPNFGGTRAPQINDIGQVQRLLDSTLVMWVVILLSADVVAVLASE